MRTYKRRMSLNYDPYTLYYRNTLMGRTVTISDSSRRKEGLERHTTLSEEEWKGLMRMHGTAWRAARQAVLNLTFYPYGAGLEPDD